MAIAFMPEKEVAPGDVSPRTARLLELIEEANAGVAGAPPPRGEAPLQVDGYRGARGCPAGSRPRPTCSRRTGRCTCPAPDHASFTCTFTGEPAAGSSAASSSPSGSALSARTTR